MRCNRRKQNSKKLKKNSRRLRQSSRKKEPSLTILSELRLSCWRKKEKQPKRGGKKLHNCVSVIARCFTGGCNFIFNMRYPRERCNVSASCLKDGLIIIII